MILVPFISGDFELQKKINRSIKLVSNVKYSIANWRLFLQFYGFWCL